MRTALLLLAALLCGVGGTGAMAATKLYFELAGDVGPCDVTGVDVNNLMNEVHDAESGWTVTLQTTEGPVTVTAKAWVYYQLTAWPSTLPWVRIEETTIKIVSPNGTQTATEADASGSAVNIEVYQDGADVVVSVASAWDTLTDTITGATLQRNRPAVRLLCGVDNTAGYQGTPYSEGGPCRLTWEGSVRAYDWTEIRDWAWSPRVVPLTGGRIVPSTGFSATWHPLWGPVTWQVGPGVPVWRLALTRINSDEPGWNWAAVRAQNQADFGAGFATVFTNTEHSTVSSDLIKPNRGCAWVVDNGTVYVALEILTVADTGQSGIYLYRQRPTNGLGSCLMDDIYEGYSPQALLLKPSQDVLLFYLDSESNVLAWRLVYRPDTSPPYSIKEAAPYDLGVTALSLGQPWLTEGGQVGLPYTDLDGNVQTIYGDASGATWAP